MYGTTQPLMVRCQVLCTQPHTHPSPTTLLAGCNPSPQHTTTPPQPSYCFLTTTHYTLNITEHHPLPSSHTLHHHYHLSTPGHTPSTTPHTLNTPPLTHVPPHPSLFSHTSPSLHYPANQPHAGPGSSERDLTSRLSRCQPLRGT